MMNDAALRKVDLNLLLAFSVLMQERNVSRAAERLLLGQPGLSAALRRLRETLEGVLGEDGLSHGACLYTKDVNRPTSPPSGGRGAREHGANRHQLTSVRVLADDASST